MVNNKLGRAIAREYKKSGIKTSTFTFTPTAEDIERAKSILEYVKKIEKAHKNAARSKLKF